MARVLFESVLSFDNDKRPGLFQSCVIIGSFLRHPMTERPISRSRLNTPEATQCLSPRKFLTAPAHPFSTLSIKRSKQYGARSTLTWRQKATSRELKIALSQTLIGLAADGVTDPRELRRKALESMVLRVQ